VSYLQPQLQREAPDGWKDFLSESAGKLWEQLKAILDTRIRPGRQEPYLSDVAIRSALIEIGTLDINSQDFEGELPDAKQPRKKTKVSIFASCDFHQNKYNAFCTAFDGNPPVIQYLRMLAKDTYRFIEISQEEHYRETEGLFSYSENILRRLRTTPYVHEVYVRKSARGWLGIYDFQSEPIPKYHLNQSVAFIKNLLLKVPGFQDIDSVDSRTREAIIQARIGQGVFRQSLEGRWDNKCAVTEISTRELLRASHIKPWALSTASEKLDPDNGLLLSANLDALFDKHLISFDENGNMLMSSRVRQEAPSILPKDAKLLKKISSKTKAYLSEHRKIFDSQEGLHRELV